MAKYPKYSAANARKLGIKHPRARNAGRYLVTSNVVGIGATRVLGIGHLHAAAGAGIGAAVALRARDRHNAAKVLGHKPRTSSEAVYGRRVYKLNKSKRGRAKLAVLNRSHGTHGTHGAARRNGRPGGRRSAAQAAASRRNLQAARRHRH